MPELVGIWRVEIEPDDPPLYVVYSGDVRLSQHEALEEAETWMNERYWRAVAEIRERRSADETS